MLLLSLLLAWTCSGQESNETSFGGQESNETSLGQLYFDILTSYDAYPPLDSAAAWKNETITPIRAVIAGIVVSVDNISPSTSEFTVSTRKILYFDRNACNQTQAHQYACETQTGNLHFMLALRTVGDPDIQYELHQEQIHESEFELRGIPELTPSLDIIQDQVTYKQEFDVRTYPYEYHNLKIDITSLYSSNIVQLELLPLEAGMLQPTVPQGWTLRDVQCNVITSQAGRAISQLSDGGRIAFSTYSCEILVSRTNTGWWMTSFLLFIGLNFISFVGGLGFTSHIVAEARDDKDVARAGLFTGLRMNGVFSIGLLLTYVFQVQLSPYDESIEFWPEM